MADRSHQLLPLLPSHLCVGSGGGRAEENVLASSEQDPSLGKGYSRGQKMQTEPCSMDCICILCFSLQDFGSMYGGRGGVGPWG